MFNRFPTRLLTSISIIIILLLFFTVNSVCSVITNIKERKHWLYSRYSTLHCVNKMHSSFSKDIPIIPALIFAKAI